MWNSIKYFLVFTFLSIVLYNVTGLRFSIEHAQHISIENHYTQDEQEEVLTTNNENCHCSIFFQIRNFIPSLVIKLFSFNEQEIKLKFLDIKSELFKFSLTLFSGRAPPVILF